jgi:hypothetical protein
MASYSNLNPDPVAKLELLLKRIKALLVDEMKLGAKLPQYLSMRGEALELPLYRFKRSNLKSKRVY